MTVVLEMRSPAFQPSTPLNETDAARLSEILARHETDRGGMLPVLQEINQSYGYIPRGYDLAGAARLRRDNSDRYVKEAVESIVVHVQAMIDLQARGAVAGVA